MARKLNQPTEITQNKGERVWNHIIEHWYIYLCLVLAVGAAVFFMLHQYYSVREAIDGTLWGQYGDFIGGVLGTLVSVLSVYYLIRTLKEQQDANKEVAANNEEIAKVYTLQQFDSNFTTLFNMYKWAIATYKLGDNKKGRSAMIAMTERLFDGFKPSEKYEDTKKAAQQQFDNQYYIPNRDVAAVHFRTLYQLFDLISKSDISEKKKVLYAKMVRSQLCEEELLLMRYNCHCHYGAKMRKYVNRYNLSKHLPLLSLGEFKRWRTFLKEDQSSINRLDSEFIGLRKHIFNVIKGMTEDAKVKEIHYSPRYSMVIKAAADNKSLEICLTRDTKVASNQDNNSIDMAFDKFTTKDFESLLKDFMLELFVYSNFAEYNKPEEIDINTSSTVHTTTKEESVTIRVTKKEYPLAMSYDSILSPGFK